MKTFKSIQVGDLVLKGDRVWEVRGIYLGCNGQENIVGLKARDLKAGFMSGRGVIEEMAVPEDLIDADYIYRKVDHVSDVAKAA